MTVDIHMLVNLNDGRSAFWNLWYAEQWCAIHFGRIGTTGQWKVYPAHRYDELGMRVHEKVREGYTSMEYLTCLPMSGQPATAAQAAQALMDTLAEELDRGDGPAYVCVFPQYRQYAHTRPWLAFLESVPHAQNENGLLVAVLPASRVEDCYLEPLAVTRAPEDIDVERLRVLAALLDRSATDTTLAQLLRASEALV